ncbi:hypothetical protein ACQP3L_35700, partial [Escherichia coli]
MTNSVIELKIKNSDISHSDFIIQDSFSNARYFVLPYKAENYSFKICEKLFWTFGLLVGVVLNLQTAF